MSKLKEFLYNLIILKRYENVIEQISEDNRKFAKVWSIVLLFYWTMSIILSFFNEFYEMCRLVYIVCFVICAITLIISLAYPKKSVVLIYLVSVLLRLCFLAAGIGIAVCQDNRTIVIFVSVIIVPLMFVSNFKTNLFLAVVDFVAFSIIGKIFMSFEYYNWTLMNLAIFSVAGEYVGYFINQARFESYLNAEKASQLVEIQKKYAYYDQLTDLKNRRAYSEKIDELEKNNLKTFAILMLDINGLKKTNDTLGHSAGDELIIGASECLKEGFHNEDMIYRIGGDEFCVILEDSKENIQGYLDNFEQVVKKWTGDKIKSISMAYGWAYLADFPDIEACLKSADEKMYAVKKEYYLDSKHDRRGDRRHDIRI